MLVTPIKTSIVYPHDDLFAFLDQSLPKLKEKSVVVVTSKIVALCEGNVVKKITGERQEKHDLARQDADLYLEPHSEYMLTIKHSVLGFNAGVDESNVKDHYVLLPKNPYASAERIWEFLRQRDNVKELGVLISDSRSFPIKWGVLSASLGACGFLEVNDKVGQEDLFGYKLRTTTIAVAEALAIAAGLEMGEANESQPLCIIEDASTVIFQEHPPSEEQKSAYSIDPAEDLFAPLLTAVEWKTEK